MNLKKLFGGVACVLASFVFVVGVVIPDFAQAQTQGDGVSAWVDRLLGGPNDATAPSDTGTPPTQVTVPNIIGQILGGSSDANNTQGNTGGYVNVGGMFNLNTIGNVLTNAVNNPLGTIGDAIQGGLSLVGTIINGAIAFVENPFSSTVNGAVDIYVEFGNQTGIWSNTSVGGTIFGDPGQAVENAGQSVVNTIVDGIVAITNEILNGNSDSGTPAEDGSTTTNTEGQTSSEQSEGGQGSGASPAGAGGGSSGHTPSGLGGLGSPSNPLSTGESDTDGSNSDDIGTNNVQTQSSPYLFEPVPGGENNAAGHEN